MLLRAITTLIVTAVAVSAVAVGGLARGAAVEQPDSRDPGAYIAGVKTLEGDPAGGLPYRLRMSPDASRESPDRVIVWFHPSGRSMNRIVEAMSPAFVARGYALLVATRKDFDGWSDLDIGRMMNITLREVGGIEGIDGERPVLMGFDAGGQAALGLWYSAPRRYAGLIVDAAYPVRLQDGSYETREPPDRAGATTPVFVLVGDDDELAVTWREAERSWRAAGVPLTVRFVPGRRHEWLLDAENLGALEAWLEEVGGSSSNPEGRGSE